METLENKWFILFVLIWLILFISTKLHIYYWWPIQFYAIDLLAIPILATLSLSFYRWLLKNKSAKLPLGNLAFLVLGLSIVFEWYLPKNNTRYTADIWDIVMYGLGSLFFLGKMNKAKSLFEKNDIYC